MSLPYSFGEKQITGPTNTQGVGITHKGINTGRPGSWGPP